jgi:hypothetical protein
MELPVLDRDETIANDAVGEAVIAGDLLVLTA